MTSKTMKAAVIGLGWAGEQHLISYQQMGVEVVAISDAYAGARDRIVAKYGIPYQYEDYRELLERDDLTVVSVATPNYLHSPMAVAAMDAGKHVLCEKPLARNAAEAKAMIDAAERNDRALMVAFNHRQRGDVRLLKTHIDNGGLGKIYHAKAFWWRRDGIPGMGGWFTSKDRAGGGPFIDLGVHMLDMALHLMGEPQVLSVSAAAYAELGARGRGSRGDVAGSKSMDVEDFATAFVRLENGVTLTLEASWAMYREINDQFGVRLLGTEGGALIDVVNYSDNDTLTLFSDVAGASAEIRPKVPASYGHYGVVKRFVEAVQADDWSELTGRDGFQRSVVLEACYRSAEEGREVSISEILASL
ncbi:MAG: Gfo/Idh/MocA family oxidoreductase [Chloroflexi bacterium]|nr:Gfo/Idh/MocA family oxidoreductase [Chloroflexota bacterium]